MVKARALGTAHLPAPSDLRHGPGKRRASSALLGGRVAFGRHWADAERPSVFFDKDQQLGGPFPRLSKLEFEAAIHPFKRKALEGKRRLGIRIQHASEA